MLVATCAECQLEAALDAAAVVEGDLRCEACDGALVLVMAEEEPEFDDGYEGAESLDDDEGQADLDDDGYVGSEGFEDAGYHDAPTSEGGYEVEVGAFGGDLSVNFEGVFADERPGTDVDDGGYEGALEDDPEALDPADGAEYGDEPGEDYGELDLGDDPFAQAAAQLDSSVSATIQRARRSAALLLGEALPPPLEDADFEDEPLLDDTVHAARTEILEGELPTEEPLPSFDGGDTYWIESLADERPEASLAPPLMNLEDTGPLAPVGQDQTGVIALPLGRPAPEPRPASDRGAVKEADPLEGTQRTPLFGDDAVDWLALLDDNLTESEEDDPTAERVYIQLPETATPNAALEKEQFQEAVRQLEEAGPEAFAQSYAKTGRIDMSAATQAISEAKSEALMAQIDTRNWSQDEQAPETHGGAAFSPGDATVPLAAFDTASVRAEGTLPLAAMDTGRVEARAEPPPAAPEQGTLEWDRSGADAALVTLLDGNSSSADYFRQLYQRVFHSERGDGPRVVLVTSPRAGEGRTTVATNLALVAARSPHRRAFLVDADPRGGGVLRYLGIRRRVDGLLEALDADEDPAKRLLPLDVPGDLRVLPLGIPGSQAIDLLASDRRVGDLLSRLRSLDPQAMIVIDGSFALNVADPLVWARLVDGVIVVARAGKTSKVDLRQALELIGFEKVLGVVLNDARVRKR